MAKKQRETNVQFVRRLMEHSKYGAISQMFIIDAIGKVADMVAAADPAKFDNSFINGATWIGVAKEIKAEIDAKLGAST